MDPITGIGLAASVVQLVNFGFDAVKTCRQVYEQGVAKEHQVLAYTTGKLTSLTQEMQQSLKCSQSTTLTGAEKDLIDLARKSEGCAHKLQLELDKLRTQQHGSASETFRKAARAIWKHNSINKIQGELEMYRSMLETSLLRRLSQRFHVQNLRTEERFASLDNTLQHIITCLAKSELSLTALTLHESEQTRQHVTAQADRLERLKIDRRLYDDIIKSLFYPEISSRQEQISHEFDGFEDSYHWIFDDPSMHVQTYSYLTQKSAPRWDCFAKWLSSGHGVYWINGKAGSGKSTLMSYICDTDHTAKLLGEWYPGRRLLTPTFFFWNSGSLLQKSIEGLLRALIYQMLNHCPDLKIRLKNGPVHAWTERRLLTVLSDLLSQTQVPLAICMFIDGLDEFDGDYHSVVKKIQDLSNQKHVKICVSSRPLPAFEQAYKDEPNLRLQDLTFDSIHAYTKLHLSELIDARFAHYKKKDREKVEALQSKIVYQADGVFLWVVVAVREIRSGLQDIVDLGELSRTIENLPPRLEDLFMLMLHGIKDPYQRDAARFLQIRLHSHGPLDLCNLHFTLSQWATEDVPFSCEKISPNDLMEACRTLRIRVLSHTRGLLDLTPENWPRKCESGRTQDPGRPRYDKNEYGPILITKIDFLHRTVRDFLLSNDHAKSFFVQKGSTEAQVHLSIARGTIAQLPQFSYGDASFEGHHPYINVFLKALGRISKAERLIGAAQSRLMRSLNYESFAHAYGVMVEPTNLNVIGCKAYMRDQAGISVDLVGMAANVGMKIFVCEQLGLSSQSENWWLEPPKLKRYSTVREVNFFWSECGEPKTPHSDESVQLSSADYRRALESCLLKEGDKIGSSTRASSETEHLAESYILSCISRVSFEDPANKFNFLCILLSAGADPMVRVGPMDELEFDEHVLVYPFWSVWLELLRELLRANRASFTIRSNSSITSADLFDNTKALLASGADINYTKFPSMFAFFKRRGLEDEDFGVKVTAFASFIVEGCFKDQPGYREWAAAMQPRVKMPTREIHSIYSQKWGFVSGIYACPTAEQSDRILRLIEQWERTGHRSDMDTLQSALAEIWIAEFPYKALEWTKDEPTSRFARLYSIQLAEVATATSMQHSG